ncbi:glycosyltransferase [Xylanibacillus composti]|uniref:Glycosyltransferase 2-like domain-containing protein n=1 Tax=Xylanibacillus composti TaxID=1572762 RepID=A0A8J4M360_9BACL|nr:glycosyltransferase [Xylanibacillus composti]MDT9724507.1 glycosyltransferase [Xylanibacillus composti]GIQ69770.1 hypothetical protein XYCOK13_25940 [Xylanibacillus composti]
MNENMKLSIIVVTMNRKDQVIEALRSCMACKLPEKTEFVIIDNASADGTGESIHSLFAHEGRGHTYIYQYLEENVGPGGGRNEGYKLSNGEYLYFLDDDAVIDENSQDRFFVQTVAYLDRNTQVGTVSTRVWDECLQKNREVRKSKTTVIDGYASIYDFHGGSHFLRKSVFGNMMPYLYKAYGFEEICPSLIILDKAYYNVYAPDVVAIHKPIVDKWRADSEQRGNVLCLELAGLLGSKYLLYPGILRPVLFAVFLVRWYLYLRKVEGGFAKSLQLFRVHTRGVKARKIKFTTLFKIIREFGIRAGV